MSRSHAGSIPRICREKNGWSSSRKRTVVEVSDLRTDSHAALRAGRSRSAVRNSSCTVERGTSFRLVDTTSSPSHSSKRTDPDSDTRTAYPCRSPYAGARTSTKSKSSADACPGVSVGTTGGVVEHAFTAKTDKSSRRTHVSLAPLETEQARTVTTSRGCNGTEAYGCARVGSGNLPPGLS